MADGARAPGFEICGRWVPPCVVLLAVVAACGRIPERDLREAEQADELPPEVIAAVPQPRPAEILGSASAFVGFLYKDGLLRNPFAYGQGAWTTWPDSRPLPTNWTLYGFDRRVSPLSVGAWQGREIKDSTGDDPDIENITYQSWGYATGYPADTTDSYMSSTSGGLAVTGGAPLSLLVQADSNSSQWKAVAPAVRSAFDEEERRAIAAAFLRAICAQYPQGTDCDAAAERARLMREGVVPGGYPIDAAQRAAVTFRSFVIDATSVLPGGLTFYHANVDRFYADPRHKTCGRSFFSANVVTRTGKVTITDTQFTLSVCEDPSLEGVTPLAVMVLEGRVYVIARKWGWEDHEDIVRELTDTGLINPPRLKLQ